MKVDLNEEKDSDKTIIDALRYIYKLCATEDEALRIMHLRAAKRNEEYWRGIQYIFWDESTQDWRLPPEEILEMLPKVMNIYKAHGESIIAALCAALPYVRFFPDDADSPDDVQTAKAWLKVAELVQKHNEAQLLFVKALFILYNQQFLAAYTYTDTNEKYGMAKIPVVASVPTELCSACGVPFIDGQPQCECGVLPVTENTPQVTGEKETAKSRTKIDVFGTLFVKLPARCRKQDDCGYLLFSMEQHYALVKELFPDIAEKITTGATVESFGRYARRFSEVDYAESNQVTVHRCWFRPWLFNAVKEKETVALLKKTFPNGCHVVFVESGNVGAEIFAEAYDEDFDDHWSVCPSGTSPYIHSDPMGDSLIPVQDMTNDLYNLVMMTIRHGIPLTFASPDVVDFDQFSKQEARPGDLYPADKAFGTRSLGEGFYSVQTTTLSKEVQYFADKIEQTAQFLVGSFPSVYGGPQEGGGTLGEYAMSRSQALQRLSLPWKMINVWWARVMQKSVKLFTDAMLEDERDVKFVDGSYVNSWIRKSALTGKIGKVESETSENFPISSAQKMDLLMKLLEAQIPEVNSALFHPNNSRLLTTTLGEPDLFIPGADQRAKQFREIQQLIQSEPEMVMPPTPEMPPEIGMSPEDGNGDMMGGVQPQMPQMISTVPIETDLDDHQIHIETLKQFLVSDVGQDLKEFNPGAYQNCLAHLSEHVEAIQMLTAEANVTAAGMPPETAAATTAP